MELAPVTVTKSKSGPNHVAGLRVTAVWVGGVANVCGLKAGDIVFAVNNASWNEKQPKKSAQRLKNELFNTRQDHVDLMVLSTT